MVKIETAIVLAIMGALFSSCSKEKTFEVQGTIVHAETQAPLSGLHIDLNTDSDSWYSSKEVQTDTNGRFIIHKQSEWDQMYLHISQETEQGRFHTVTEDIQVEGTSTVEREFSPIVHFEPMFKKSGSDTIGWASVNITIEGDAIQDYQERKFDTNGSGNVDLRGHGVMVYADRTIKYKVNYQNGFTSYTITDSLKIAYPISEFKETIFY